MHHPDCDVNDPNIEGIRKPCNCPPGWSGEPAPESRGASQLVGSDASGSVSDYDALCLAVSWEKAADEREKLATEARRTGNINKALPLENSAAAYMRCARELTKLTGYPNVRQPTQNASDEPRPLGAVGSGRMFERPASDSK